MEKRYNLFTAITMVMGIVIGSGIFFKTPAILVATEGNVAAGVLAWIIGGFGILFGALAMSKYATRNDKQGGIIQYAQDALGTRFASSVAWFMTVVYMPALTAILCWVTGMYAAQLFGFEFNSLFHWGFAVAILAVLYITNVFIPKVGGKIQNITTILKLIPLVVIAIVGLLFGQADVTASSIVGSGVSTSSTNVLLLATAALVPVAFSYDGWIISTSISGELENATVNLPKALVIGAISVMTIYITYFIGLNMILGPDKIIELGDAATMQAAIEIFGPNGGNIVLTFIVISVLGGTNGLSLATIRMANASASAGLMKDVCNVSKLDEKTGMPYNSAVFGFVLILVHLTIHYCAINFGLPFAIDEFPIGINYIFYTILYFALIRDVLARKVEDGYGTVFVAILAIIGSLFVLYGSFVLDPLGSIYIVTAFVILAIGQLFFRA